MAAGVRMEITVNDAPVQAAIAGLAAAGANLEPAFDEIGAMLVSSTLNRFETGSGPDGGAWPPSIRAQAGGQTLVDSGRLRASITHQATADGVEVGTNVMYAATHQFGARIKAKGGGYLKFQVLGQFVQVREVNIPARPFLGVDEGDRAEIINILNDHLLGAVQ